MSKRKINDETLLSSLTVGELKEVLTTSKAFPIEQKNETKRFVYGLQGIRKLFNVSHTTAQKYKNTFLRGAVIQNGRVLIVDVEKALQLFADWKGGELC